jgi:DNA polymerase-3 subunit epsilon
MYAIVDIETTGGSPLYEKITEIAIYIHDGYKVVDEFSTLINPEKTIPYFITGLTGITNEMVAEAPKFYEVARKIVEMTEDKIFVAHNVTFDYNFIRTEFKNLGYDFRREKLCTVKLSRKVLPGKKSYSLGNLCKDIGIQINGRHRAAGDAFATVKLLEILLTRTGNTPLLFEQIRNNSNREVHFNFDRKILDKLPEEPGVYYFHDDGGKIIYVGKSKNIRQRVMSHLYNNAGRKAMEMKEKIADISWEHTGSELIALLLESDEIKKLMPVYNRTQRRSGQHYGLYARTNPEGYLCMSIEKNATANEIPVTSFQNKKEGTTVLERLVEKYTLCQKLTGIYKSVTNCFHYEIGACHGACIGEEPARVYNQRVENALNELSFVNKNFILIDKGRNEQEFSAVSIKNGKYIGFGYFSEEVLDDKFLIEDCVKKYADNRDVQQILRNYIFKNEVLKVISY